MQSTLKNIFLLFFVFLFKSRKKNTWNPKAPRILVVSTTALGDTLWATPLIRAIKKSYPTAHLGVLTSKIGWEVLENNPYVDELFLLKEPLFFHFFSLFKILKKRKFEAVLYLHASQRLPLPLCGLLNSSYLIGSVGHGKGLGSLFTHQIKNSQLHEIKRRLQIASLLGIEEDGSELNFFFTPVKKDFLSKPYIVFHPGAKEPFRRWPAEYYIELGEKLSKDFKIAIIGVPKEKALIEQIASRIGNAQTFYHNLSLTKTASLLQGAKLLVCNDSGPMHLAAALQVPLLAFFIPTDSVKCGPLNYEKATVLQEKMLCRPCLKKECLNPYCFYQIKPEIAYIECLKLLKSNP